MNKQKITKSAINYVWNTNGMENKITWTRSHLYIFFANSFHLPNHTHPPMRKSLNTTANFCSSTKKTNYVAHIISNQMTGLLSPLTLIYLKHEFIHLHIAFKAFLLIKLSVFIGQCKCLYERRIHCCQK